MSAAVSPSPVGRGDLGRLEPGFADPVRDAQACFRAILDALAHPGRIVRPPVALAGMPPAPLGLAAAAVALTLCDLDTPVWLDPAAAAASGYIAFHCGAPLAATPAEARFAFIADPAGLPPLNRFALGSDEYPERGATVVIETEALAADGGVVLRGPGIHGAARLRIAGLPSRFWEDRAALAEVFPRGLDLILVNGDRLAALPRTTRAAM